RDVGDVARAVPELERGAIGDARDGNARDLAVVVEADGLLAVEEVCVARVDRDAGASEERLRRLEEEARVARGSRRAGREVRRAERVDREAAVLTEDVLEEDDGVRRVHRDDRAGPEREAV